MIKKRNEFDYYREDLKKINDMDKLIDTVNHMEKLLDEEARGVRLYKKEKKYVAEVESGCIGTGYDYIQALKNLFLDFISAADMTLED
ncbi:MAG: hypothetical protein HUJ87_14990 [Fusobacterium varium]|uniref:hypothetical protein n=1 Tax=Fusobacterium varium TaxID=856 RepID=UPI00242EAAC9|nr:hypothetical protein [Fusobacterium varium]MCF0171798.1 hypothetical protein [Fusobacterium varium]